MLTSMSVFHFAVLFVLVFVAAATSTDVPVSGSGFRIPSWQEITGVVSALAALIVAAGAVYKWTMRESEIRAANASALKDEATAESNLLATATAYINRQEARIKALEERCDELQAYCDKIQDELGRYRQIYPPLPKQT